MWIFSLVLNFRGWLKTTKIKHLINIFNLRSVHVGLVGTVLSHENKEAAHSLCRIGLALGFVIGFMCTIFLNTESVIWVQLGIIIVTMISYSVLIFVTKRLHRQLPCYCNKSEKSN